MPAEKLNIQAIFNEAIALAASEDRARYLDQVCADDHEIRARVDALLNAHSQAGGFFGGKAPSGAATELRNTTEAPGAAIGPYKLIEQIGEGGMGTVWMAQQSEPVRRLVAVKLIKLGLDSREVIARFDAERQALALMDHPNIAKVIDAGTAEDSGRPYVVMELVKGVPITRYCDEHHLTPRQRLALFMPVCQAIQHAHQKGIIHRDIKPSNVLVALFDDKPVPKIIDFGVAKATGQQLTELTLNTGFGTVVGTLEYMSPEQAGFNQLDIDTRSDIYSLGVLLYELLSGSPPFQRRDLEQAGLLEMLRVIREQEPSKPSTKLSSSASLPSLSANRGTDPSRLTKLLRGELDWIVMKALEKDRSRRYETANGLAADVQRYLEDEPVQACPPSVGYRLRKFVRRHKGPVLAASATLLALTAGVIGTTWGMFRAEAQRQVAEKNATSAVAREAETTAILRFVEGRILSAARPEGLHGGLGRDVTLRQAIEAALPYVEESFRNQPLIEARVRMTLGASFYDLDDHEDAAQQYGRAREIYAQHFGPEDPATLRSTNSLASAYVELGRYTEALKLHQETLRLLSAKLGPDHIETLGSRVNVGVCCSRLHREDEAIPIFEATLPVLRTSYPDHAYTLICLGNLATSYSNCNRMAEAIELDQELLILRETKVGLDHPETLGTRLNLANSFLAVGRVVEAIKLYEDLLPVQKRKLGPDHRLTLDTMTNLAVCYQYSDRFTEALQLHKQALAIQETKYGPDHPSVLGNKVDIASCYSNLGREPESIELLEQTLPVMQARIPEHKFILNAKLKLANGYSRLGQHAKALKFAQEVFEARRMKLGDGHADTLTSMHILADVHFHAGKHAESAKLFTEAVALRKAKLGPRNRDTLKSMHNLAISLYVTGRRDEATKQLEEVLPLEQAVLGSNHSQTLDAMEKLASIYFATDRVAECLKLLEEVLPLQEAKSGPDHSKTLNCRHSLACVYTKIGQFDDARRLHEETFKLRKAKLGSDDPATLWSMWGWAEALINLDRGDEALPLVEECLQRAPGKAVPPNLIPAMLSLKSKHYSKMKNVEECRKTAMKYEEPNRSEAEWLYGAACLRAILASVIQSTDKSDAAAHSVAIEADRAMEWLRKAITAGFSDVKHLKQDADLDVLRERQDFQKLVADLEAKQP